MMISMTVPHVHSMAGHGLLHDQSPWVIPIYGHVTMGYTHIWSYDPTHPGGHGLHPYIAAPLHPCTTSMNRLHPYAWGGYRACTRPPCPLYHFHEQVTPICEHMPVMHAPVQCVPYGPSCPPQSYSYKVMPSPLYAWGGIGYACPPQVTPI